MKRLQFLPTPPACLAAQPKGQNWDAFSGSTCHAKVGQDLKSNQGFLCCYCESSVVTDGHIEHLEPRNRNPKRMYDHSNLAYSCNGTTESHCGHCKGGQYDAVLFISPYEQLTTAFFQYLPNGIVEPEENLSAFEKARVEYTIQILELDCPSLNGRRRGHAKRIISILNSDPSMLAWLKQHYLKANASGAWQEFQSLSSKLLT
jgi:uncharacterized protein (TIGR02646 family)